MEEEWCDSDFGFGPFVEQTNSFTLCFCATVFELPSPIIFAIFGIPSLRRLSKEPFVNPASSLTFSLKLCLSAIALLCSMLLAMFSHPASTANTWAQSLTAAGWLLSILMLVTGYLRAKPQLFQLRLWWVAQFIGDIVVFANHSTLDPPTGAHIVRGISLSCAAALCILSLFPEDVPKYQNVTTSPLSSIPSRQHSSTPDHFDSNSNLQQQTVTTPLLISKQSNNDSSRYGLASQLSQATLYGADTSVFKGAISAWDEAVVNSYKETRKLQSHEEEAEVENL